MLEDDAFRRSMSTAVGNIWLIEESPADTVEDVKEQERLYDRLRGDLTRRYARLADLVTATRFGVEVDSSMWNPLADYATGKTTFAPPRFDTWLEESKEAAAAQRFFHWELEFPEVFFDRHGKPLGDEAGFDAVVGNPPYISANELNKTVSEYAKPYWKNLFSSAAGAYDIYVIFIEQCLRLVREGGLTGLIVPNKWLSAPFGKSLREHLVENHTLVRLRDLSRIAIFDNVSVYPIVSIIKRGQNGNPYSVSVDQVFPEEVSTFIHPSESLKSLPDYIWGFLLSKETTLIEKIVQISNQLDKVSKVNASTTASEADSYGPYLAEENTSSSDSWKIVNTGLIDRFSTHWGRERLTHQHKQYIRPVLPKAAPVVSRNRFGQYSAPKLIFAKMALRIEALVDHQGSYASMNTNFALENSENVSSLFLGAVCNSRLLSWVYGQYFDALRMSGGYYQFQAPQIRTLPIRHVVTTTSDNERESSRAEAQALYEQFIGTDDDASLIEFIKRQLPLLPNGTPDTVNERSDVVHDFLAYLAQQMINLNEQRQESVEYFVLDLEGVLSESDLQKIGRLWTPPKAPKQGTKDFESKQAKYTDNLSEAEHHLGSIARQQLELREAVGKINEEQWKWLLKHRLKKIDSFADLVGIYRKRQPAIATLDRHIVSTDRLIDQVVYKLYGLTEDEIVIIESADPSNTVT